MHHRGACACDNDSGDGAGVLCAIPHQYYADEIRCALNKIHSLILFQYLGIKYNAHHWKIAKRFVTLLSIKSRF